MSSLLPSVPVSQVGRAASDLGLAALLGGTLYGRVALHPALARVSDPRERGEVLNAAWRRYGTFNSAGLAAVAGARAEARDAALSPRERRLARAKDALVGAVVRRRRGDGGRGRALLAAGAGRRRAAARRQPPRRPRRRRPPRASSAAWTPWAAVTLATEAALVAVNAALSQENFRRAAAAPPARRRARLTATPRPVAG